MEKALAPGALQLQLFFALLTPTAPLQGAIGVVRALKAYRLQYFQPIQAVSVCHSDRQS
jgi:hypothetical protein